MILREDRSHAGAILLRLTEEKTENKIRVLERLLIRFADQIPGNFVVATEDNVRIVRLQDEP